MKKLRSRIQAQDRNLKRPFHCAFVQSGLLIVGVLTDGFNTELSHRNAEAPQPLSPRRPADRSWNDSVHCHRLLEQRLVRGSDTERLWSAEWDLGTSIIQCYSFYEGGGEGRLQVDELVHQQQGAGQAGQAGFRAATVTARVAS
ncbi:hypothetical protein INR49_015236 [Caranx melampygus]|nr:hypothetical protein INR49_015236 [Caranx melampygus]